MKADDTYADLADILPDQFGTLPGTATFSVGSRYYVISVTADARWRLRRMVGGDPIASGYSETVEQSWRIAALCVPRAPGAAVTAADLALTVVVETSKDGVRLDGDKVVDLVPLGGPSPYGRVDTPKGGISYADSVMPTGINVDRVAWLAELQRLLAARADADALFRFVDRAMTAAHDQALLDVTVYDEDDRSTWPNDGQGVAVEMMFMSDRNVKRPLWVALSGEDDAIEAATGDRWLWVPPEATDG